ncbi:MAG: alpha/beta hydrolase, partial [Planktomarina sp.]
MIRSFVFGVTALSLLTGCDPFGLDSTTEMEVVGTDLHVSGVLTSETHGKFTLLFANYPEINRLVLGEIEGSTDDEANFPFYREVRRRGLGTYLKADSEVYSGGADLFIAGKTRLMERGAVIGVHSWSDGTRDAVDFPRSSPEHEMNRSYVEDMLGND